MNPLIQFKTTPPLLITVALLFVCFGILPKVQAVRPSAGRRLSQLHDGGRNQGPSKPRRPLTQHGSWMVFAL